MSQTTYDQYHARAFAGQLDGIGDMGVRPMVNSALDAKNTWTVAVPGSPDDSADYSVQVSGGAMPSAITATYAADASSTQAEVAAGLLAALQATDVAQYFAISEASNTITLQALTGNVAYTVTSPSNASTTADLTVTEAIAAAASTAIPDGRFIVRSTSGTADTFQEGRLPTAASNISLAGVTTPPTHARERSAVGNTAKAEYAPNDVMDVVNRTPPGGGIWVKCDSAALTIDTTLYIDTQVTANRGGLTATSTDNLALPTTCKPIEGATTDQSGGYVIKVAVNLP
ncbi:MAG: hypothetical protein AAFQ89_23940 [Cyanobacteria bacterium J06626_18]